MGYCMNMNEAQCIYNEQVVNLQHSQHR